MFFYQFVLKGEQAGGLCIKVSIFPHVDAEDNHVCVFNKVALLT